MPKKKSMVRRTAKRSRAPRVEVIFTDQDGNRVIPWFERPEYRKAQRRDHQIAFKFLDKIKIIFDKLRTRTHKVTDTAERVAWLQRTAAFLEDLQAVVAADLKKELGKEKAK